MRFVYFSKDFFKCLNGSKRKMELSIPSKNNPVRGYFDEMSKYLTEAYEALKEYVCPESNNDIEYINPPKDNKHTTDYFNNIDYEIDCYTKNSEVKCHMSLSVPGDSWELKPIYFAKGLYQEMRHHVDFKLYRVDDEIEMLQTITTVHKVDGMAVNVVFSNRVRDIADVKDSITKLLYSASTFQLTDDKMNKLEY